MWLEMSGPVLTQALFVVVYPSENHHSFLKNGWLEDDPFLVGWIIFSSKLSKLLNFKRVLVSIEGT